jgi:hypothetical protein
LQEMSGNLQVSRPGRGEEYGAGIP